MRDYWGGHCNLFNSSEELPRGGEKDCWALSPDTGGLGFRVEGPAELYGPSTPTLQSGAQSPRARQVRRQLLAYRNMAGAPSRSMKQVS